MPGRIVAYHRRELLLNMLEPPIMAVAFLLFSQSDGAGHDIYLMLPRSKPPVGSA